MSALPLVDKLDPGLRWHIEQRIDSYSLCMDDPEYVRACQDAVLDVVARFLAGEDLWADSASPQSASSAPYGAAD